MGFFLAALRRDARAASFIGSGWFSCWSPLAMVASFVRGRRLEVEPDAGRGMGHGEGPSLVDDALGKK